MTTENKIGRMLGAVLIVAMSACIEPYNAPDINEDVDVLVVDGFLNATDRSATVKLTRTSEIENEDLPVETGALVTIRSENGDVATLAEQDLGRYVADGLAIDHSLKYQLNVVTERGEKYASDFIAITETPVIDSLSWRQSDDGVQISASTHDVSGKSLYYKWSYVETWEYHAPFLSAYKAENKTAIFRNPDEFYFTCYQGSLSKDILIATTERLTEDLVSDFPIVYVPRVSNRISVLYHIKVQQRVIEKEEFEFWRDLERVTETVGGLFDSQPYEIVGNVHNLSDPSAPVLGYFSGGSVAYEEMFLPYNQLTDDLKKRPFHGCNLDTVCVVLSPARPCGLDLTSLPNGTFLISTLSESGIVWGFTSSSAECADCRHQGGTLVKPDFWP